MIKCLKCGECCRWITFVVDLQREPKAMAPYYNARGCKIFKLPDGKCAIVVPSVCPHLTAFGCKNHNSRPLVCKNYDGRVDPVINCKMKESQHKPTLKKSHNG